MRMVADVKCYHCGHVSGQVEGSKTDRLLLDTFNPRPGFQGDLPRPGQRLRCERCSGPVYLEEIRPVPGQTEPLFLAAAASRKRTRAGQQKYKAA